MPNYPVKKKLLSPDKLAEAAQKVLNKAKKENVKAALVGGFALQSYGSPRLTGDIDIIASREIPGLKPTKGLSFGGYVSKIGTVPVDVIIRNDDFYSLYEDALFAGVKKGIVIPEYLAAMKMVAGRRTDMADLEFLISEAIIDIPKTRGIIKKHLGAYAAKEFDTFVEETLWKKSKEK